ncbi:MAG: EI24 domain-containing protein [Bdellovibrionales bacterium]|nr:EI24 domain-containing protein [Bdellovibrionales bacterium]
MSAFFFGLTAVWHGYRAIFNSQRLKLWALLPIVVAVIVFLAFGTVGLAQIAQWNPIVTTSLLSLVGLEGVAWLWWFVAIGLWPIWFLLLGLALYLLARLIVAPLYSMLAERTLIETGVRVDEPFRALSWMALTARMAWISLLKTALFAVVGMLLFGFSFIPGLNVLATIGFVHIVAFDICDYSFEAMGWPLAARFRHFRAHWPVFSGFAFGLGVAMLIPGLNLLLLPGAVVGGALIVGRTVDRTRDGMLVER